MNLGARAQYLGSIDLSRPRMVERGAGAGQARMSGCKLTSGSPAIVSIAFSAWSRVCMVTKPQALLLPVLRSRNRLTSSTTPNCEKKVLISCSPSCVGALE